MYNVSFPILNGNFQRNDRKKVVEYAKAMGVKKIFLAVGIAYKNNEADRKKLFKTIKENVAYLKEQGFFVGVWIWTFWVDDIKDFTFMKFTSGNVSKKFVCPADEAFRRFAREQLKAIAECGVDIILFDDDYRYGYLDGGQGCVCEHHLKYMEELLGEEISQSVIDEQLVKGPKNKYRSAWLEANRYFMLKFADEIRSAVDEVRPEVRIGLCSCMSVWDFDGADSIEISKALAGKTKPFLRLSGAPYWAVNKSWGNRLQDVIELERMELSWCEGEDIEILVEGDVYPRPRYTCPASYLEGFDTALRADGKASGIMKYVFDYTSTANYETGYIDRHLKNVDIYKNIEEMFSNKAAVGVRVYEAMKKFEHMDVPAAAEGKRIADMFFSPAARMLAANSIPTIYNGDGLCGIAFGENVKYIPDEVKNNGLILDARAAQILSEQGIDVGIENIYGDIISSEDYLQALSKNPFEEYFVDENEYTPIDFQSAVYKLKLNDKAKVQSYFVNADEKIPASYIYENASGQRFFVLAFEAYFCSEVLYRKYTRARQLAKNVEWLSKKKLPAYIGGHPDLYMMCKGDENSLTVGLWNFFADSIDEPYILLDREYDNIKFLNCSGSISGNKVALSEINAFGFAAFEVY